MKTYELTLVKDYVSHWGVQEAVREFLQNALDSPDTFSFQWVAPKDKEGWTLLLRSSNTRLTASSLLLGATTKTNDDKIGSFGEGYKIGLLVLTRLDHPVIMKNDGVIWTPKFQFSEEFQTELLAIDETPDPDETHKGLTVVVSGLTDSEKAEIVASCIKMQAEPIRFKATKYGSILLDQPKRLYCGGLFVCETDLQYGYNILPKYLRLERDRQTVDSWDLGKMTLQMQIEAEGTKAVAKMIANESPDVRMAEYYAPEDVKEECLRLFREDNPTAVVAQTREEASRLGRQGLPSVVHLSGAYGAAIRSAPSYVSHARTIVEDTPVAILQRWLVKNRAHMQPEAEEAFDELVEKAKHWVIK